MPLYEYQCRACGHRFERIQKSSDPPVASCPSCGGDVEKLLSSPAIQFKGSGWYITDYAKSGKGPADTKKTESAADGKTESKGETKAETKAETKSSSEPAKPGSTTSESK
jgi:putative FmdB family regulatory protein